MSGCTYRALFAFMLLAHVIGDDFSPDMHSEDMDQGRPPDDPPDFLQSLGPKPHQTIYNYTLTDNYSLWSDDPDIRPFLAYCQNMSGSSTEPVSRYECMCMLRTCVKTMHNGCRNFEFVVSFVLVSLTCMFGLVGNVLSILTLRRDSIKSVTTFLLSALAVADFSFLIPAVFVIMIPTYCEFYQHCVHSLILVIPYFEQFGWAIASTTHSCTVYITVLVAIHRFLWVCKPNLAQKLSGLGRARIQVAIVPVCALIYNSPRFLEFQVRKVKYNFKSNNGTEIRSETIKELNKVGRNSYFQYFYKNVCFFIVMYLIPLVILVMVSVSLIRTLKQRRATLQRIGSTSSNASQSRRDDNITFVLIIIIAAFIVCQTPTMLQRLFLAMAWESGHTCPHPYFYMEHIADYMALLNSSTNFVIYILFSPHFRRTLMSDVLNFGGKTQRATTALRHFSRLSKSKKTSDEKNATLIARETRIQENGDLSDPNQSNERSGNQNGQTMGVQWLTPPDVIEKSNSHSTQMTSHEFLTLDGEEVEMTHKVTVEARQSPDCQDCLETEIAAPDGEDEDDDDDAEIEVPLIAYENASSQTDAL